MAEPALPDLCSLLSDQRRRSALGEPFRAESYCQTYPALRDDVEGLLDLIYNEVVLREERGETPALDEYVARFPELAGPLGDVFEVHRAIVTTSTSPVAEDAPESPGALAGSTLFPAPNESPPDLDWPVLDGYEITGFLGSGGMGVVYRARDCRRGVTVAVKMMRRFDAAAILRFKKEFRALRDVVHPNLVTLHELISDGRSYFIVMEYVDGVTLLDHVRGVGTAARRSGTGEDPDAAALASTWTCGESPTLVGPGHDTGSPTDCVVPAADARSTALAERLRREGRVRLRRALGSSPRASPRCTRPASCTATSSRRT